MEFARDIADDQLAAIGILAVGEDNAERVRVTGRSELESGLGRFQDQCAGRKLRQPEDLPLSRGQARVMGENATPNGAQDWTGQRRG